MVISVIEKRKIDHDQRREVGGTDGMVGEGMLIHVNREGKCPGKCYLLKRSLGEIQNTAGTYPWKLHSR